MDAGTTWQLVGGSLELLGLGMAAWGISKTRAAHTGDPSAWTRAVRWIARTRLVRRFRRPRNQVIAPDGIGLSAETAMRVRARLSINDDRWREASTEDKLQLLLSQMRRAEEEIGGIFGDLDRVMQQRDDDEAQRKREQADLEQRLGVRIDNAAAGDLTIATWGVSLAAGGVALSITGLLIG